jgi:hypothetical protein
MLKLAPLAYKYVAIAAMLAEVNYCSDQLNLPLKHPLEEADLRSEVPKDKSHSQCRKIQAKGLKDSSVEAEEIESIIRIYRAKEQSNRNMKRNGRSLLHTYCTDLQVIDYQWSG